MSVRFAWIKRGCYPRRLCGIALHVNMHTRLFAAGIILPQLKRLLVYQSLARQFAANHHRTVYFWVVFLAFAPRSALGGQTEAQNVSRLS